MPSSVDYRPTMSSSDAIIWNIEKDPQLRSTVMSVWILDEAPTESRMAANIARMVDAIPRLRQRVVEARPRPYWDEVSDLRIDDHFERVALSGGGLDVALAFANEWVLEPFDRDRPLWKLGLLTGLDGGKAAAIIKVHHAIADGMGMVLMLAAFTDFERLPATVEAPKPASPEREAFTPRERLRHKITSAAASFARSPSSSARRFVSTVDSAIRLVTPHRTPHSKLMTNRSANFRLLSRRLPLDDVKQVARGCGVSLNDTFVSAMADAITAYHRAKGFDCPELRMHMPVNARNERTASLAGNQFVPARVSLNLSAGPADYRRKHVSDQLLNLRAEPALGHVNTVSAAIQRLGKPISRFIIGGMMKGVDVLLSNVPGPPMPLFLAGGKVEEFYNFGPPAGAALNATLFSYDGSISIGFTVDTAAVADVKLFERCLDRVLVDTFSPASAAPDPALAST